MKSKEYLEGQLDLVEEIEKLMIGHSIGYSFVNVLVEEELEKIKSRIIKEKLCLNQKKIKK